MAEEEEKKTKRPETTSSLATSAYTSKCTADFIYLWHHLCPIGGLLYWNSSKVDEIMINYSYCEQYTQPVYLAESLYEYQFGSNVNITQMQPPAYHVENSTTFLDPSWQNPTISQSLNAF
ncbi:unnamed protein product [Absidia cylindrospora]